MRKLLAICRYQGLRIRWRRYKTIKKINRRYIVIAHRVEPVLYLFTTTIAAMNLEIKLIISDTERRLSRFNVVDNRGAGEQQHDHQQCDELMLADSAQQIVEALEKGRNMALTKR